MESTDRGFTLIELLVTIAIIGVLAAIAIPQYKEYRVAAFNARAKSDLRAMITAQEVAYQDRDSYADCSNQGCNPALPGFTISPGIGGSCAIFDDGESYQCGIAHAQGTRIYYYTSRVSAFWDTPR